MADERRQGERFPIQVWVEESHGHTTYFQHSGNLSAGGIFLDQTIPHPVGTRVRLQFQLPGDAAPIRVRAEIVSALERAPRLGMGMKFLDLPPGLAARIDQFIGER